VAGPFQKFPVISGLGKRCFHHIWINNCHFTSESSFFLLTSLFCRRFWGRKLRMQFSVPKTE
jgi:hypothetical protein